MFRPTGRTSTRSVPLRVPADRDLVVAGLEFRPGNRRVVHHSRIHLDVKGAARRLEAARSQRDHAIGEVSTRGRWSCRIRGWGLDAGNDSAPRSGRSRPSDPARVGRRAPDSLPPDRQTRTDQSSLGLFLAKKPVTKTMAGYSLCTDQIDIPAGAKRHKIILSTRLKADVHLYSAVPHAHNLCREFRLAATLPDGTSNRCCGSRTGASTGRTSTAS